jgi:hypothetical protein
MEQWLEHIVFQALEGLDQSHSAFTQALPCIHVLEMFCRSVHTNFQITSQKVKQSQNTPDTDRENSLIV